MRTSTKQTATTCGLSFLAIAIGVAVLLLPMPMKKPATVKPAEGDYPDLRTESPIIPVMAVKSDDGIFRVTKDFLDKLAVIESNNTAWSIGDNGNSRGLFQISYDVWLDVTTWRIERGVSVVEWDYMFDRTWNSIYAREQLEWLAERLLHNHGEVSERSLFWAYQVGIQSVLSALKSGTMPPSSVMRHWNKFDLTTYRS